MKNIIYKITSVIIITAMLFLLNIPIYANSQNKTEQISNKIQELEELRLAFYVMSVYYSDLRYVSASWYEDPFEGDMSNIDNLSGDDLKNFIASKMEVFAINDIMENFDQDDDDDLSPDEILLKHEILPRILNIYSEHGRDGLSMGKGIGLSIYNELTSLSDDPMVQSMLMPIYLVYYYNFAIEKTEFLLALSKNHIDSGISSSDYNSLIKSMEETNKELIATFDFGDYSQDPAQIYKILYQNSGNWSFVDNPEGNLENEIYDLLLNPDLSDRSLGLFGIIAFIGLAGLFAVTGGVIFTVKFKKKPVYSEKPAEKQQSEKPTEKQQTLATPVVNQIKTHIPEQPKKDTIVENKISKHEDEVSEKELYINSLCEKYNTTPDKLKDVIKEKIKSSQRDAKSWDKKASIMAFGENTSKLAAVTADAFIDGLGNVTGLQGVKIKAAYKVVRSATQTLAEKGVNTKNFVGGVISGASNSVIDFVKSDSLKASITVAGQTVSGAVTDGIKGAKDGFISGSYDAVINYGMDKLSASSLHKKVVGRKFASDKASKLVNNVDIRNFTDEYSKTVINTSSSVVNQFIAKPAFQSIHTS